MRRLDRILDGMLCNEWRKVDGREWTDPSSQPPEADDGDMPSDARKFKCVNPDRSRHIRAIIWYNIPL